MHYREPPAAFPTSVCCTPVFRARVLVPVVRGAGTGIREAGDVATGGQDGQTGLVDADRCCDLRDAPSKPRRQCQGALGSTVRSSTRWTDARRALLTASRSARAAWRASAARVAIRLRSSVASTCRVATVCRARLRALATEHPLFGDVRLYPLLRRERFVVTHKRVHLTYVPKTGPSGMLGARAGRGSPAYTA